METRCLETTDIFRGAFFLCSGARLTDVRLKEDARRIVSFLIEAEDIAQLDSDYRTGDALVNPLQFRETLNHLRDILFNKLREYNPASHKCYAAARRRYENDRKRNNRGYKDKC